MEHNKQKELDDHHDYHNKNVQIILNAPVPELPKQKVDDTELWKDIFLFMESHIKDMTYEEQMEELQKHYTITRK